MKDDSELTQRVVADRIHRSETWVSRLLAWFRDGCQEETVFGAEIARRRADLATSQESAGQPGLFKRKSGHLTMADGPWRQLWLEGKGDDGKAVVIEGGPTDAKEFIEEQATLRMLMMRGACQHFVRDLPEMPHEMLLIAFRSAPTRKRRLQLEGLISELEKSITAAEVALGEYRSALREVPRQLDEEAA